MPLCLWHGKFEKTSIRISIQNFQNVVFKIRRLKVSMTMFEIAVTEHKEFCIPGNVASVLLFCSNSSLSSFNFCRYVLNFLPQAEATIMATSAWRKRVKGGRGCRKSKAALVSRETEKEMATQTGGTEMGSVSS